MPIAFRADATHFEMAGGVFDSNNKYFRKVGNPADKTVNACRGKSFEVLVTLAGGGFNRGSWRWRSNTATAIGDPASHGTPDGFNVGLDIAI
jgi:hypothetical protein